MLKQAKRAVAHFRAILVRVRIGDVLLFAKTRRNSRLSLLLAVFLLPLFFLTRVGTPAYAATNSSLNFQARLQSGPGTIAPDGYYNVEFKLYDAASLGTLLWTETYSYNGGAPDNRVRVANGYLSVNLGSITAFPSTIPWDQQLYLTMNIGGTGTTASWDGEMSPRLRLTAVPYAFNAETLITTASGISSTLTLQAPTVGNQIFQIPDQGAAGTYTLLTGAAASGSYIQLQGTTPGTQQTGNFNISGTGIAATALESPTISLGTGGSATGSIVLFSSTSTNKVTITTAAQTAGNLALTIPNAGSLSDTVCLQTLANCLGGASGGANTSLSNIASTNLSAALNVTGGDLTLQTTTSGNVNINPVGTINLNSDTTLAAGKSLTYTTGAGNFDQSASTGTFKTGTGAVTISGNTTVKPANSATAFQVQNASATALLTADTTSAMLVTINGSFSANGNIAYPHGVDFSTIGINNNVSFGTGSVFRLTGASAQTITGIAGGTDGRTMTIINAAAQAATLSNNSASSLAANRIITGTGIDLTIDAGASVTLVYDSTSTVWRVIGTVSGGASGGSYVTLQGSTPGTADTGNLNISGTAIAASVLTSSLDTASAGTLTIGGTNATTVNIAANNVNHTINIGTSTVNSQAINIGSGTSGSATILQGDFGQFVANGSGLLLQTDNGASGFYTQLQIATNHRITFTSPTNDDYAFMFDNSAASTILRISSTTNTVYVGGAGGLNVTGAGGIQVSQGGVYSNGAFTITASAPLINYATPGTPSSNVGTLLDIENRNLAAYQQVIALGIGSTSAATSRVLSVFDARAAAHQPTIAVFNPGESDAIGFSWDGSNTTGLVKTLGADIGLNINGTTIANFGTSLISLNQATTSSGALTVNNTELVKTTSATALQVQDASANILFTVDTSTSTITFGTGSNTVVFTASGGLVASGTAQHTKKVLLTPEYAGAVLDAQSDSACAAASNGTMTAGYDSTNRTNYYNWTSTQATSQCYDVVVQVPIPSDFSSWSGIDIQAKTSSTLNSTYGIAIVDSTGTYDTNYASTYAAPGTLSATSWSNLATSSLSGTYTAGNYMTIKFRMSAKNSANLQLGNITLTYKSQF